MTKSVLRRYSIAVTLTIATLVLTTVICWPTSKPVLLQTEHGLYQVAMARYVHGTNLTLSDLTLSVEDKAGGWIRRHLDQIGVYTTGSRNQTEFRPGIGIHAIVIVLKGQILSADLAQADVECITEDGKRIRLNDRLIKTGPAGGLLVMYFTDSEIADLHRHGFSDSEVTNFFPKQMCVFRKSNHEKLSAVDLDH